MAQDAVRVVRAQRMREDLARHIDIVGEAAAAGDKLGILLAWHRLADAELEIGEQRVVVIRHKQRAPG